MQKIAAVVVFQALALAGLAGGGPGAESLPGPALVEFAAEGGEQSVSLAAGQVLEVILPGNPTTGYAWSPEGFETQEVLDGPADVTFESATPGRMGSPGIFRFRFRAAAAGSASLRFLYRRAWEKDVEPLHAAILHVTVPQKPADDRPGGTDETAMDRAADPAGAGAAPGPGPIPGDLEVHDGR